MLEVTSSCWAFLVGFRWVFGLCPYLIISAVVQIESAWKFELESGIRNLSVEHNEANCTPTDANYSESTLPFLFLFIPKYSHQEVGLGVLAASVGAAAADSGAAWLTLALAAVALDASRFRATADRDRWAEVLATGFTRDADSLFPVLILVTAAVWMVALDCCGVGARLSLPWFLRRLSLPNSLPRYGMHMTLNDGRWQNRNLDFRERSKC